MAIEIKGVEVEHFVDAVWKYAKTAYSEWAAGKDDSQGTAAVESVMINMYLKNHADDNELTGDLLLKAAATEFYAAYGADWGLTPNSYFNPTEYKAAWINTLLATNQAMDTDAVSAEFDAAVKDTYGGDVYLHYLAQGANIKLADGSIIGVNTSNKFDDSLFMDEIFAAQTEYETMAELRQAAIDYAISPLDFFVDYPEYQIDNNPPEVPTGERVTVDDNTTTGSTFTLTNGTDIATANIFNAGLVYTPGGDDRINSLQNEDKLTGEGENPTLNATLGNANDNGDTIITPHLNKIEIVNVDFTGNTVASSGAPVVALDMQDANKLTDINITRISQSTNTGRIENIKQKDLDLMSIANTHANNVGIVEFSYAAGVLRGANESDLKLSDVQVLNVNIGENISLSTAPNVGVTGYETLNIASVGAANTVGVLNLPMDTGVAGAVKAVHTEDENGNNLDTTLNLSVANGVVTAATNTTNVEAVVYSGGINQAQGRIATFDASELQASLALAIGSVDVATALGNFAGVAQPVASNGADILSTGKADTSGVTQDVTITGTKNSDTFYLNDFIQAGDVINGNDGADTIVVYSEGNVGKISSVETVDVRIDGSRTGAPKPSPFGFTDTITLNFANIADAAVEQVRNITNIPSAGVGALTMTRLAGDDGDNQLVNLYGLSAAQANAISIAHSTTANNAITDTTLNATLAADTPADSMTLTISESVNIDPRFSFTFNNQPAAAPPQGIENMTFVNADTESNSILLSNVTGYRGTITVKNAPVNKFALDASAVADGTFISFDSGASRLQSGVEAAGFASLTGQQLNALDQRGGYRLDANGMTNDYATLIPGSNVDRAVNTANGYIANPIYATLDNGAAGDTRITAAVFDASESTSDVIARFGDLVIPGTTRSMSITGGIGNDTFIFDAQGIKSAGYTSGDTVTGGKGIDTLVIDGSTSPGLGGNVFIQNSEWDDTKGIDVLRLAGNGNSGGQSVPNVGNGRFVARGNINVGGYYVVIDNEFVKQTDAGNNLKIISNDGDLAYSNESDLVLDLKNLTESSNVQFVGASGKGVDINNLRTNASNRLLVSDHSANGNNTFLGGDTNAVTTYSAGAVSNVLSMQAASFLPNNSSPIGRTLGYQVVNGLAQATNPILAGLTRTLGDQVNADLAYRVANGQLSAVTAAITAASTPGGPDLAFGQYAALALTDGNNNVLEVFDGAEITIDDLTNVRDFSRIEATNTTTVPVTLKMPDLTDTVMDQLVDSSHAASPTQTERLAIIAYNHPTIPGAVTNLDINASAVSGNFGLEILTGLGSTNIITGSAGQDVVVVQGNYFNVQVPGKALPVSTFFSGANKFIGNALTPTNVPGRLVNNSSINLGAGDQLITIGGVRFTNTSVLNSIRQGSSNLRLFSDVSLEVGGTGSSAPNITVEGSGAHVISFENSGGGATIDLSNFKVKGVSAADNCTNKVNEVETPDKIDTNMDGTPDDVFKVVTTLSVDDSLTTEADNRKVTEWYSIAKYEDKNEQGTIVGTYDYRGSFIKADLSELTKPLADAGTLVIMAEPGVTVTGLQYIQTQDGAGVPVEVIYVNDVNAAEQEPCPVIVTETNTAALGTPITVMPQANDTHTDDPAEMLKIVGVRVLDNNGDGKYDANDGTAVVINNGQAVQFTPGKNYVKEMLDGKETGNMVYADYTIADYNDAKTNVKFEYTVSDGQGGYDVGDSTVTIKPVTPGTITWPTDLVFDEATANNGTVTEIITVTLANDTFTTAAVPTFTGVPTGLTAAFTRVSDTTGTISLTGTAAAHENANDIQNLVVTFDAADFAKGVAATNASNTLKIDFDDTPAVTAGTLGYSATTLKEAATNDGKVTETITVTLSNDTFVAAPTAAFTGVPAGLTAAFTRVSDTTGTISLTGNAAAHANANDASFTIAFDANDFTKAVAPTVASQAILVDFADTATYTDKSADLGTAQTADTTLSGTGGSFNFTDNATAQNNVVISNFTTDDKITVSGVTTGYSFSNSGTDVAIEYNNGGTLNKIVLTGVVDASSLVYDEASFEAAIGFNAFSYA